MTAPGPAFALPPDAGRQPNPFYHPAVLAGFGLSGALPIERRPYGARAWRSDYTFTTAPRDLSVWPDVLAAAPRFLRVELLPEDGPAWPALREAAREAGGETLVLRRRPRPLAFVAQPIGDGPLALDPRLSGQRRRRIRRQWRRFEEGGGRFDLLDGRAALEAFLPIEASGWKGRAGTALAHRPADLARLQAGFEALGDGARLEGAALRDARGTVAAGLVLRDRDEAFFMKIAHDETAGDLSPGTLLTAALAQAYGRDPRVVRLDSCATEGNATVEWLWPDRRTMLDVLVTTRPTPAWGANRLARGLLAADAGWDAARAVKALLRKRARAGGT